MEFVIVTGMSGAGKSCVVDSLEDIGFFCVDNLPSKLIPVFAQLLQSSGERERVAVVTDVRSGQSFSDFFESLDTLRELQISYKIMFLDAKDDVLVKRYKETRRKHPLVQSNYDSIANAINEERKLLAGARANADYLLETSNLSATQCRVRVLSMFSENKNRQMHIHCMSFGFKHGIPNDADFVYDVRFLPNPFYIPELKQLTGLDNAVNEYVMQSDDAKEYEKKLFDFVDYIIPLCQKEGRSQLIIAIGCTGGHHRSVTFAENLYKHLNLNYSSSVSHRDILK
ncbi:MAG: RNase adapter RapZ [Faecalibacterium sp.]|nr:RNase adapter RapZ [Ruminococcus sp.]MCM1391610.1 RNase adapter RapZ [Ruminococcus sp.]MCM1485022.1 RNase adapter RapZ [Faecalibacterium sp.]